MHGIDEGKGLAFLDGEACDEVEFHLRTCEECSETCNSFGLARLRCAGRRCGYGMRPRPLTLASNRCWTHASESSPRAGHGHHSRPLSCSARWRVFVGNLSEVVESICGSATGRLVGRAASALPWRIGKCSGGRNGCARRCGAFAPWPRSREAWQGCGSGSRIRPPGCRSSIRRANLSWPPLMRLLCIFASGFKPIIRPIPACV